jgi:hypothetical protein
MFDPTTEPQVWQELPVPGSTDTIVLLDPDQSPMTGPFHNLLRYDSAHHTIWTATLPDLYAPGRPDCYVSVRWEDDTLDANTWSGHRVRLDPATGAIVATTFVK